MYSQMTQVKQHLNSSASSIWTARRSIATDNVTDLPTFQAGLAARKKGISEAAEEARLADDKMQEILGGLRDIGVINEDHFRRVCPAPGRHEPLLIVSLGGSPELTERVQIARP